MMAFVTSFCGRNTISGNGRRKNSWNVENTGSTRSVLTAKTSPGDARVHTFPDVVVVLPVHGEMAHLLLCHADSVILLRIFWLGSVTRLRRAVAVGARAR